MSIDGFVERMKQREAELTREISDIIKKNGGVQKPNHYRSQSAELAKVREAIAKATRVGIQ